MEMRLLPRLPSCQLGALNLLVRLGFFGVMNSSVAYDGPGEVKQHVCSNNEGVNLD